LQQPGLGMTLSPAYDLVNLRDYHYELLGGNFALLETSRGCPYSCTFCNRSMFQNRYRRRTGEQILQEIDTLITVHGCRALYIFDLEFTLKRTIRNDSDFAGHARPAPILWTRICSN